MKFIPNAVTVKVARTILVGKKHSPTILFAGGVVGVVATTVTACRATLKVEEVLEKTRDDFAKAKVVRDSNRPDYTESDYNKDMLYLYIRGAVDLGKLYGPSIVLGALSIAALTGSHNILTKRNAALTAAYSAVEKTFAQYRSRVVNELGEDKDREFRYGSTEKTIVEDTDKGPKKTQVKRAGLEGASMYARLFGEYTNKNWQPTREYNLLFLRAQQNYLNDQLQTNGHVLLNDAYDALGFERTKAGCVVGWIKGEGDDEINFGIWSDRNMDRLHDFMIGVEDSILLDFNVDGIVYDKI